jgi:hypothetical protein
MPRGLVAGAHTGAALRPEGHPASATLMLWRTCKTDTYSFSGLPSVSGSCVNGYPASHAGVRRYWPQAGLFSRSPPARRVSRAAGREGSTGRFPRVLTEGVTAWR